MIGVQSAAYAGPRTMRLREYERPSMKWLPVETPPGRLCVKLREHMFRRDLGVGYACPIADFITGEEYRMAQGVTEAETLKVLHRR